MEQASDRRRIVVVNDTEEILALFRDIIEGMGHECLTLAYAPDDLAHIKDLAPDMAIIDFVMGGMEYRGWQLVQKIKMSRETANIPIIVCTGAKREVYEQEGWLREKGVVVLLKPFDIEDLERAVQRTFENLSDRWQQTPSAEGKGKSKDRA